MAHCRSFPGYEMMALHKVSISEMQYTWAGESTYFIYHAINVNHRLRGTKPQGQLLLLQAEFHAYTTPK